MRDIDGNELPELPQCWLTIGAFDGVHVGHQKMVQYLVEGARAQQQPAVALTFHPHPQVTLKRISTPFYLTSPSKRSQLLRAMGVDRVITLAFDKHLASQSAWEFMDNVYKRLHPSQLVEGPDFALGKNRGGSIDVLRSLGKDYHFEVASIEPVMQDGEPVSSSRIRGCIAMGDILQANRLLGREHSTTGSIHANGDATRWQFIPQPGSLLPPPGDYPVRIAALPGLACTLSIGDEGNIWIAPENGTIQSPPGDDQEIMFLAGKSERSR